MRGMTAVVFLLAFLLAGSALAQQRPVQFGLKGGLNLANVVTDPEEDPALQTLLGFSGGAGLSFNVSPGMSFDLDVLYVQKGAKQSYEDGGTARMVFDYVVASPTLRFRPGAGKAGPYLLAGGEIGYLMDSVVKIESPEAGKVDIDVRDHLADIDYGLNFGAGLEFPMGRNGGFFLEGHYALGLADISLNSEPEGESQVSDSPVIKTRGIYALAGMRF